jgi:hypothetical protein
MFYSKSTGGFYDSSIHGENIPADAVEISDDEHQAILEGQSAGLRIVAGEDGRPALVAPPPPTAKQVEDAISAEVQRHLDEAARSMGYDDIRSAVSYADEPAVPEFQAEGRALRAWRSLVWAYCYEVLAAAKSGAREAPTAAQLISELPALELPA